MSANIATKTNTGSNTSDKSILNKMSESIKSGLPIGTLIGGITLIVLLITIFVKLSGFAGDVDNWTALKPKVNEIMIYSLVATFIGWMTLLYYVAQRPEHSIYITLSLAVLALGLAFAALSTAVITR